MLSELLARIALADTPGCSVGLLAGDSEPEFAYRGLTGRDGEPTSADTLWEAASLSKPVVALLALDLSTHDAELLTQPLITSAEQFGAAADDRWNELTLWHLLTHTTGLPNWRSTTDLLSFEHDPGSPGYSGEGFELLLIELAARLDSPAETLLERHLRRLQMARSSFTPDIAKLSNVAIGHTWSGAPIPKSRDSAAMASGSLHTTASDYMRFLSAVAQPTVISDPAMAAAVRRMTIRSIQTSPGVGRTLGWAFTETPHGDVLWQHGDNPGFKHIAAVRPDTGQAVLVFTNGDLGQAFYRDVCQRILEVEVW